VSFLRYFLDKQKVAKNSPMFFVYESILPFVLIQKVVPKNQGGINPLAKKSLSCWPETKLACSDSGFRLVNLPMIFLAPNL